MDRRAATRTKKRLTCTLVIDASRLSGIVLDLSGTGFFVQTSANPVPGTEIGLELDLPGQEERLVLAVRVARRKVVPPRLKSVVHGGLGLEIQNAPEAYYGFVAQLQAGEDGAAPSSETPSAVKPAARKASGAVAASPTESTPPRAPSPARKLSPARKSGVRRAAPARPGAPEQKRFRVRVSQTSGSRSRSLDVSAISEAAARREALAACGEGWKILACELVA
jgi:hypothetical protein